MAWLYFAFLGITIWSASAIGDRFLLLRHVQSKKLYVIIPAFLQFFAVLLVSLWISLPAASLTSIAAAIGSGAVEAITLYYLYVAISKEEISRVFPLTAAGPIFTLLLGFVFLHDTLSHNQLLAFACFLVGGLLLAMKLDGARSFSLSRALKPLFIGSLLSAVFTLLLKFSFDTSDFWTGFFYSRFGFFLAGLLILAFFYKEIRGEWMQLRPAVRLGIAGNQLVALSGHGFYFLAISMANAALVQSVLGAQSAIIFVFAVLISLWSPQIIEERIYGKDLLQKGLGILFVILASYLLAAQI